MASIANVLDRVDELDFSSEASIVLEVIVAINSIVCALNARVNEFVHRCCSPINSK